jgi:hypothetical protein
MKTKISSLSLALLFIVLCAGPAFADTAETMIIKLKTDDFEIAETDISNLQVGEAETIVTDSGRTIDLLRTTDGVEIYLDGELLEIPDMSGDSLHEGHHTISHRQIHVECEVDGADDTAMECADEMMLFSDGDSECLSDEEGACVHHNIIHSLHDGESSFAKVIIIEKAVVAGDP